MGTLGFEKYITILWLYEEPGVNGLEDSSYQKLNNWYRLGAFGAFSWVQFLSFCKESKEGEIGKRFGPTYPQIVLLFSSQIFNSGFSPFNAPEAVLKLYSLAIFNSRYHSASLRFARQNGLVYCTSCPGQGVHSLLSVFGSFRGLRLIFFIGRNFETGLTVELSTTGRLVSQYVAGWI